MMTIANPIYGVVFKYLMEDERIARTILSALLKEDIIKVEMQDMNVEDEYYSIIKEQEGKLYGMEKDLAETKDQLKNTKGQLEDTKGQLEDTKGQLEDTKGQLEDTKEQLRVVVKMLVQAGQTIEAIADSLHIDKEEVVKLYHVS